MPTLLSIVRNATDTIDLSRIEHHYPWLYERERACIVSPDSDGLLCGLCMSSLLGWRVKGFYDGKLLVCDAHTRARDCVFLDMEVFREGVRSLGQHLLLYNGNQTPDAWNRFGQAFAINNIRGMDGRSFRRKYPFGSIHFLLVALSAQHRLALPDSAISPLLFTDGTYHNLFRYTENCYDWLRYLGADQSENVLAPVFQSRRQTTLSLMRQMMDFWDQRDAISNVRGERGDRIAITRRGGGGESANVVPHGPDEVRLETGARQRGEAFLRLLGDMTEWQYQPKNWSFEGWRSFQFTKGVLENATIRSFDELLEKNPVSFAMTANRRYEYTLEEPEAAF